ncbi:hypothetical protein QP938_01400 [Porticoccaceae bacterium LTM1]|nr:hypothetical protein QP938_01400 [Porticoccaceae bacterium LTM1]
MNARQLIFGIATGAVITCLAALLASQQIISWSLTIIGAALLIANGLTLAMQRLPFSQLKAIPSTLSQPDKR